MCKRRDGLWCLILLACGLASAAAQASPQAVPVPGTASAQLAHDVPVMDGGAGPCSVQLTVTTGDGKPVYAAVIKVHIAYGFGGFHKLDLQASTNIDGKANFTGLPVRVRRPPLEFQATNGSLSGTATSDPESECHAKHDIMLSAQPPPGN
jgi:hypothetical protein